MHSCLRRDQDTSKTTSSLQWATFCVCGGFTVKCVRNCSGHDTGNPVSSNRSLIKEGAIFYVCGGTLPERQTRISTSVWPTPQSRSIALLVYLGQPTVGCTTRSCGGSLSCGSPVVWVSFVCFRLRPCFKARSLTPDKRDVATLYAAYAPPLRCCCAEPEPVEYSRLHIVIYRAIT